MKTITITKKVYNYNELSDEAKARAKSDYLDDYTRTEDFYEMQRDSLASLFPHSGLDLQFSLASCQGDGANIYGKFALIDFLPLWEASEKEKRTIAFYINESIDTYKFSENNRYCYSCKFLDKKYIDDFIDEFVEELKIKNIKIDIIQRFFNDLLDYFDNLDKTIERQGYDYLYNIDDDEFSDICVWNDWEFLEDGTISIYE